MDYQRIRNLTTGRLHSDIGHVYQDIEFLTGKEGIMTHQLPNACQALEPFLRERVKDERFWEDKYDPEHVGELDIQPLSEEEQGAYFAAYNALPNPLLNIGSGRL